MNNDSPLFSIIHNNAKLKVFNQYLIIDKNTRDYRRKLTINFSQITEISIKFPSNLNLNKKENIGHLIFYLKPQNKKIESVLLKPELIVELNEGNNSALKLLKDTIRSSKIIKNISLANILSFKDEQYSEVLKIKDYIEKNKKNDSLATVSLKEKNFTIFRLSLNITLIAVLTISVLLLIFLLFKLSFFYFARTFYLIVGIITIIFLYLNYKSGKDDNW